MNLSLGRQTQAIAESVLRDACPGLGIKSLAMRKAVASPGWEIRARINGWWWLALGLRHWLVRRRVERLLRTRVRAETLAGTRYTIGACKVWIR
jgi:hypothetical protein